VSLFTPRIARGLLLIVLVVRAWWWRILRSALVLTAVVTLALLLRSMLDLSLRSTCFGRRGRATSLSRHSEWAPRFLLLLGARRFNPLWRTHRLT
jgi:hypothetical protein